MVDITATIAEPEEISVTVEGGITNFIGLTDTPSSYSGQANKVVSINSGETALEFTTASGAVWGSISGTLSNQTDLQTALDAKEEDLTFSTGLTRSTNTITTNDSQIDHDSLSNTHNLTTDISHDSITSGTIASHDTTATGANLNTLTGGGDTTLHDHDGISENTTHRGLTDNPHSVTAAQVSLGNVSNVATDDTAYNSTSWNTNLDSATKNAIRDKVETMDTAIGLNTAKDTNVSTDLSLGTITSTTMDVNSSDGTNATLISADTNDAGLLTAAKFDEITANNAKVSNVTTNLSEGTSTTTTVDVNSSDGTNATLQPSSTSRAGVMSKAKFDEVVVNNAKVSNVTTNLSAGTRTTTTIDVNSSDGTSATLVEADTTNAGILGSDKWDEIVANTAAKHTQNTDTALGSGAVAADHGTGTTDQIINVSYGTSATPPTASTTTEGSLYIQYTA